MSLLDIESRLQCAKSTSSVAFWHVRKSGPLLCMTFAALPRPPRPWARPLPCPRPLLPIQLATHRS